MSAESDQCEARVIIKIKRTGGFAGEVEDLGTVDTHGIGDVATRRIDHRLQELRDLQSEIGADLYRYELEVRDDEGETETITFSHGDPDSLPRPLMELLDSG